MKKGLKRKLEEMLGGRFKEKVAPNIGYSFGATNSYLDTSRDMKKDAALAAAGLKWDPDTQTYTK